MPTQCATVGCVGAGSRVITAGNAVAHDALPRRTAARHVPRTAFHKKHSCSESVSAFRTPFVPPSQPGARQRVVGLGLHSGGAAHARLPSVACSVTRGLIPALQTL